MKRLLILILSIFLLMNFDRKQSAKDKTEPEANSRSIGDKIDPTIVYWKLDLDTIHKTYQVNIENDKYEKVIDT